MLHMLNVRIFFGQRFPLVDCETYLSENMLSVSLRYVFERLSWPFS